MRMHNPPHPGLVLREYPGGVAVSAAAKHLRVTRVTLSRLLNGRAGLSASMALRLAAAFRASPEFWMNMQSQYDLWQAGRRKQPRVESFDRLAAVAGDRKARSSAKKGRDGSRLCSQKLGKLRSVSVPMPFLGQAHLR